MKAGEKQMISTWDLTRLVILAIVWLVVLAAPLSPAYALTVSAQTEEGEGIDEGKLPMTFQSVEAAIHNQVAATQSWFHFRNNHDLDLEVTCEFVLGPAEFVEGFSYYNGSEKIIGEVLEKAAAEEVYQELTQIQRTDPGLLEQVGNRFRFRVYPVQPGETKPVEVRHLSPLARSEGVLEYTIPKDNLPQAETVFSLVVDITDEFPVRDVETVGFNGRIDRFGARHVRVTFEGEDVSFADDLKIRYRVQADDYGIRVVTHRSMTEEGTFMLLVTPKDDVQEGEVIGRDVVFVIDISGSMGGEPLERTKWALVHILDQLNPQDRFEIVAFDDSAYPKFRGLVPATSQYCKEGQKLVSELQSQGGTNILNAMEAALDVLEPEAQEGRPRAIIFLTDGQGVNPASTVISAVRQRDNGVRVYSFGVGNGVNRAFLQRIARENRGIATMVNNPEHLEQEMERLYQRISKPLMVDLEIQFEGVDVHSVYPRQLPDLYGDGEVVVMGRYSRGGRGRVVVTGQQQGQEASLKLDLDLPASEQLHAYIEKLWAKQRIDDLMDVIRDQGTGEELTREVTRLGIVYNLVTEYTTFLAVPESLKTDEIKKMIREGKMGYDKKLIDSIEGIKLSMQHIPPGDPVLTVDAPADAIKVEAYFPFGLVKRMKWDAVRQEWNVRFLVPRDVCDGLYEIRVLILHVDGTLEWRTVEYYIDGTAPEFDTNVPATAVAGETVRIEVDPFETVREVYMMLPDSGNVRIDLKIDIESGKYVGEITLPDRFPEGPFTLRIVVRDMARNRFEQDFEIWEEDDIPHC
jgi:Ca-activated chloride channel homolog